MNDLTYQPTYVAVYGTLKSGHGNYHRILKGNSRFIGPGLTVGKFVMINSGFPVIQEREGVENHPVAIDLFDIGDVRHDSYARDTLRRLDALEGEGVMYHRRVVSVILPHRRLMKKKSRFEASIYVGSAQWDRYPADHETYLQPNGTLSWPGRRSHDEHFAQGRMTEA